MAVELTAPPMVRTAPVDGTRPGAATAALSSEDRIGSVPRRITAWFVDFALVALVTGVIGSTQSERLAAGPLPLPDPPSTGPYLTMTLGDTVHRWSGGGLWATLASTLIATLLVTTLIPANAGGSSPGLRVMGLRVAATNGSPASMGQHFVRTVIGVVDLVPWVAPGLLGWLLAARSPRRQRLGDRAAHTMVVHLPARGSTAGGGPLTTGDMPTVTSAVQVEPRPATGEATSPSRHRHPTPSHRSSLPKAPPAPTGRAFDPDGAVGRLDPADSYGTGTGAVRPKPAWDGNWNAWVITDPATGRGFRHDPVSNSWHPLA